jgi:hypothetical protein
MDTRNGVDYAPNSLWEQGVGGSNPLTPTIFSDRDMPPLCNPVRLAWRNRGTWRGLFRVVHLTNVDAIVVSAASLTTAIATLTLLD